jgi:lipopolysaccharide export system ATP-binding protein
MGIATSHWFWVRWSTCRMSKDRRRSTPSPHVFVRIWQGEIVGLLGPNGAGKTTTFYMIAGLIPPAGHDPARRRDITRMPMFQRARRGIGYLSQEPSIFRKLSVEENIMAILETLPIDRQERERRLEGLLDELSIKHLRAARRTRSRAASAAGWRSRARW